MKKNNSAFSIVELSITFVIIAIVAAGVTYGMKVQKQAEVNAVVADVESYIEATSVFQSIYGYLPGDMANTDMLPAGKNAYVSGNGNGVLDPEEEPHFWHHLAGAGLIKGDFDGTKGNSTNATNSGALPAATIQTPKFSGGFAVYEDVNNGLTFKLAGFNGDDVSDGGIIKPIDAEYLDKKFDDGNPLTGKIRAVDGSDIAAGGCVDSGQYHVSEAGNNCVLTILASNFKDSGIDYSDETSATKCEGAVVGSSRVSPNNFCPPDHVGRIVENCTKEGEWKEVRRYCSLRKCIDGKVVGQTRKVACPHGQKGSVSQICGDMGVYENVSNNCVSASEECETGAVRKIPCPYGQTGLWEQSCVAGIWQNMSKNCSDITCAGGLKVGEFSDAAITCPTNYSAVAGQNAKQVCRIANSGANGELIGAHSPCAPNYEACQNPGQERDIGCPRTQFGKHTQKCNESGFWQTQLNTCANVNCGGAPIGSSRIADGKNCPSGTVGNVLEVCTYRDDIAMNSGIWRLSTSGCVPLTCSAKVNATPIEEEGNAASWSEASPGATIAANSCFAGYSPQDGQLPQRYCGFDGNWLAATNPCTTGCPAGVHAGTGTIWTGGTLGQMSQIEQCPDVTNGNMCPTDQITPQRIYRACYLDGTWSEPFGGEYGDGGCVPGNADLCVYGGIMKTVCPSGKNDDGNGNCVISCPGDRKDDGNENCVCPTGTIEYDPDRDPDSNRANEYRKAVSKGKDTEEFDNICIQLKCPEEKIHYKNLTWFEVNAGTNSSNYSCFGGHTPVGVKNRYCNSNGQWQEAVGYCRLGTPPPPPPQPCNRWETCPCGYKKYTPPISPNSQNNHVNCPPRNFYLNVGGGYEVSFDVPKTRVSTYVPPSGGYPSAWYNDKGERVNNYGTSDGETVYVNVDNVSSFQSSFRKNFRCRATCKATRKKFTQLNCYKWDSAQCDER